MTRTRRLGRRPKGLGDTRATIIAAAATLFAKGGLEQTTLRAIAREAEVDPALVLHYFGSKEGLFFEVMRETISPHLQAALQGTPSGEAVGDRIVGAFLTRWDSSDEGAAFSVLFRAGINNERVGRVLREFIQSEILGRLSARLARESADLRVGLVATQLIGLGVARYVLRLSPVAEASREALVDAIGPVVTEYLIGTLPGPRGEPIAGQDRHGREDP